MATRQDLYRKYSNDNTGAYTFSLDEPAPTALIFIDVDGVLTNGQMTLTNGKISNSYSVKDGHGFQLLKEAGVKPFLITKKARYTNRNHRKRAELLEVPLFEVEDKYKATFELIQFVSFQFRLKKKPVVAAIGDDLFDIPMLMNAEFVGCPFDAHSEVIDYVNACNPLHDKVGIVLPATRPAGISCFRAFAEIYLEYLRNKKIVQ
jgi:3-deoxy-D-manno-octulosonate 8-phosphate phosphatase KdsC-like HAD superfamily phosphatase